MPIQYVDDRHVRIGKAIHSCTGPRTHMNSTGEIENFRLLPEFFYDPYMKAYMLVGLVGDMTTEPNNDLNKIML